jgi:hypothetical protein
MDDCSVAATVESPSSSATAAFISRVIALLHIGLP